MEPSNFGWRQIGGVDSTQRDARTDHVGDGEVEVILGDARIGEVDGHIGEPTSQVAVSLNHWMHLCQFSAVLCRGAEGTSLTENSKETADDYKRKTER